MLYIPTQFKRRSVPADTPRVVVYQRPSLPKHVLRRVTIAFPEWPIAGVAIGPQCLIPGDLDTIDNVGALPSDVGFGIRGYIWGRVYAGQMYEWWLMPEQWLAVQARRGVMTLGVTIEYHWKGLGEPPRAPDDLIWVNEEPPPLPEVPTAGTTELPDSEVTSLPAANGRQSNGRRG